MCLFPYSYTYTRVHLHCQRPCWCLYHDHWWARFLNDTHYISMWQQARNIYLGTIFSNGCPSRCYQCDKFVLGFQNSYKFTSSNPNMTIFSKFTKYFSECTKIWLHEIHFIVDYIKHILHSICNNKLWLFFKSIYCDCWYSIVWSALENSERV